MNQPPAAYEAPKKTVAAPDITVRTVPLISVLWRAAVVALLLYCFLVGVKTLGGSIKLAGAGFAKTLFDLQANPFISLMAGILSTCLFQSSSVTTSMIVGLVSGGVLTMQGAVPMIMGANIGTSVTNTLVSLGCIRDRESFKRAFSAATVHDFFNLLSVAVLLPLELMTGILSKMATAASGLLYGTIAGGKFSSPVKAAIKPAAGAIKDFVTKTLSLDGGVGGFAMAAIAAAIIFASLFFIVKTMESLIRSRKAEVLDKLMSRNVGVSLGFGVLLTIAVQSSSITTSLLVPMAGAGLLSLGSIFPVTVGANIGTTVTAMIAALAGNAAGLAIAFAHLFFNLAGMLIWFVVPRMRAVPMALAEWLGAVTLRNRAYAVAYVAAAFFLVPFALIAVGK
jgi:sodium-dependent phosphate cotransporter